MVKEIQKKIRLKCRKRKQNAAHATIACIRVSVICSVLWFLNIGLSTAYAQIVTDGSVGAAVSLDGPDFVIPDSLGAQHGSNLFHSFSDFNIGAGQSATFTSNYTGLTENIISRVTGQSPSSINGLLQSNISGANLWLINPNGIVFGTGSSLNVSGSFHAATADYLDLKDGGRFGADITDPNNTLLTVAAPSAFGFVDASVGIISVQSVEGASTTLQVSAGKSLSLVGRLGQESDGNTNAALLEGATLQAPGGNIHLVSVNSPGVVAFEGQPLQSESLSGFSERGAIEVVDSKVVTSGATGGRIFIHGGAFSLSGSVVDASGKGAENAGEVEVDAQSVLLTNQSLITASNVDGLGGEISMQVNELDVRESSHIEANTSGIADSGVIRIIASNSNTATTETSGLVAVSGLSGITTNTSAVGHAGLIDMSAERVTIADAFIIRNANPDAVEFDYDFDKGIQSSSSATGVDAGDAGRVFVNARELALVGGSACESSCVPFFGLGGALIGGGAIATGTVDGGGGEIRLRVDELSLDYGAMIALGSTQSGGGSSLSIEGFDSTDEVLTAAKNISLKGNGFDLIPPDPEAQLAEMLQVGGKRLTGIFALGQRSGAAGDVSIVAESLRVESGSFIWANSTDGDVGDIVLQVDSLVVIDDSAINASSQGLANAGRIEVRGLGGSDDNWQPAASVLIDKHSAVTSSSESTDLEAGNGGEIEIAAKNLTLSTDSRIHATIENGQDKSGGTVTLHVDELSLEDSRIQTTTYGAGDAGDISISGATQEATKSVSLVGILRFDGIMSNSKYISSAETTAGDGGLITMIAEQVIVDNHQISAATNSGAGGIIDLHVDTLTIMNGGMMRALSNNGGTGGRISIAGIEGAAKRIEVSGVNSSIVSNGLGTINGFIGTAGSVSISVDSLIVSDSADISATTIHGPGGAIVIDAAESIEIVDGASVNAGTSGAGNAGTVLINARGGLDIRNAEISSSASTTGSAGDITIHASGQLVSLGQGSMISVASTAEQGRAGSIEITAQNLRMDDGSRIDAQALSAGALAGNINLLITGNVHLSNSIISGKSASADLGGGSFLLSHPVSLLLEDHSLIRGSSASESGGSVRIEADAIVIDSTSSVEATGGLFTIGSELVNVLQIEAPELHNASESLQTRCTPTQINNRSTLFIDLTPTDAVRSQYELAKNSDEIETSAIRVACR